MHVLGIPLCICKPFVVEVRLAVTSYTVVETHLLYIHGYDCVE